MKKWLRLLVFSVILAGCKSAPATPAEPVKPEMNTAYKQQQENFEKGIYFRGKGSESDWSLKISDETIEFTSLKPGYELFSGNHTAPVRAMDANVKKYSVTNHTGTMIIQIMQQEGSNTMTAEIAAYSVRIEIQNNDKSVFFTGRGNYITDYRLHDIWVLEKINGEKLAASDFTKNLPNLEINCTNNTFMGFAGCNRMNGNIFFERGLLRFTNFVTTEMACLENNKEADFLKTLQNVTTYKVENLRLTLTNPSGSELVFIKVD